ncbi:MAG: DEAD/DEAH box helicase [Candidatus Levybacteria bacterium]|nr:DEAD/DEAH box helicase [Candidatus Levybacteria bacterium]
MYRQSQSQSFRPRNNFRKRPVKSFNPALLVRKADEQIEAQVYIPTHQFRDFPLSEILQRNIEEKGYVTPTPIQDQVITMLLEGKDVVGIANTGTGKTAAFLLPLLHKIIEHPQQRVLIVAPTRELAVQIQDEAKSFAKGTGIFSVLCIGGVGMHQQIQGLRRNPQIVIGTPGRLKDLKNQGKLSLATFGNIVLDEVDRMLDMGFINDVKFLVSHLLTRRQSLFFSATLSPQIKQIIDTFAHNPAMISVKSQETATLVDQDIIKTQGRPKFDVLCNLLQTGGMEKVIIFGKTKWGIEKLSKQLIQRGFGAVALHGNKNQNQRQRALDDFKNNKVKILLATDIVARGIDIDDVTHVINFDLPETYEDYVHRIGRTGRNGKKGIALSFID